MLTFALLKVFFPASGMMIICSFDKLLEGSRLGPGTFFS